MDFATLLILLVFRLNPMTSLVFNSNESDTTFIQIKKDLLLAKNNGDTTGLNKCIASFKELSINSEQNKWLANYYVAYTMMYKTYFLNEKDERIILIDEAIKLCEQSLKERKNYPDFYILLGALYNLKLDIYKDDLEVLLKLKEKRDKYLRTAKKLDNKNPRYYLVEAQSIYYTPKEFGGGLLKAKSIFEHGLKLFSDSNSNNAESIYPDWGRTDLLFWLGHIAEEQDELAKAINYYKDILVYEPDYKYVRDDLLPSLEKKYKNQN